MTPVIEILESFIRTFAIYINYYNPPTLEVSQVPYCDSMGIWRAAVKIQNTDCETRWEFDDKLGWVIEGSYQLERNLRQ